VGRKEGFIGVFCGKVHRQYCVRGLGTAADLEYGLAFEKINKKMYEDIETVFLLTLPEHTAISSTIVRDILRHRGDASQFLPSCFNIEDFYEEPEES